MVSVEAAQHTIRTNPQRTAQLQQAKAKLDAAQAAIQARLAELGETKQLRQHAVATHQEQVRQAAYKQVSEIEDGKAQEAIAKWYPAYKTPEGRRAVSEAARAALKNEGLSDNDIQQIWAGGTPVYARTAAFQNLLAKAGMYDAALRRAREAQKANVPQVLKPGVARPRGAGGAELVRSLERQLAGETGNQALKTSVKLAQARRAAGVL
jgi:hypothetical protein